MVGGGVANMECARVLRACEEHGIKLDIVDFLFPEIRATKDAW